MLDADHVLWPTNVHVAGTEATWPVAGSERMSAGEREMYIELVRSVGIDRHDALRNIALSRDIDYTLERIQARAKWFIPLIVLYIAALAVFVFTL